MPVSYDGDRFGQCSNFRHLTLPCVFEQHARLSTIAGRRRVLGQVLCCSETSVLFPGQLLALLFMADAVAGTAMLAAIARTIAAVKPRTFAITTPQPI